MIKFSPKEKEEKVEPELSAILFSEIMKNEFQDSPDFFKPVPQNDAEEEGEERAEDYATDFAEKNQKREEKNGSRN